MRNKSTIYLTGHFHYYLVSYNTTGALHSSDELIEFGATYQLCSTKLNSIENDQSNILLICFEYIHIYIYIYQYYSVV